MKISIITVSYNARYTIEQTIKSVLNQSYCDIEYIVIDGGSTDGTVDVIKKYDDKISYWCSEADDGIYDAMNKGIEIATGDYIQIIGADDWLYALDTIEKVVACIDDDTDIFSAARFEVDEKRKIQILTSNETAKENKFGVLPWMPHTSLFVRSSYMKKNLFDTSYKISADYKFILNAYMDKNVHFKYEKFPVAYFSLSGVSGTANKIMLDENIRLYKELSLDVKFGVKAIRNHNQYWKCIVKKFFDKIGMLTWFLCKYKGWEKHKCNNEFCRWCSNI